MHTHTHPVSLLHTHGQAAAGRLMIFLHLLIPSTGLAEAGFTHKITFVLEEKKDARKREKITKKEEERQEEAVWLRDRGTLMEES